MRRLRERFLVLAAPLLLTAQANGAGQAFERLLTSNPAADYHPAVSPEGRWLVYTSDRDGAPGLYSRDLRAKGVSEERRVAPHPSKSDGAVFSPDGRYLAFTSYRSDAFGDIFLMRFPDGEPRAVTQRGAVDSDPEFSADGRSLYFRSGAIGGEQVPTVLTISDGTIRPRGEVAGLDPAVPFPALVVDGLRGVALLYSDDTNGDHDLGAGDAPSAWIRRDGAWWQVSYTIPGASGIALNPATGDLVVSARWFDNEDVAVLARTPLQTAGNVAELLAYGEEAMNAVSPGPEHAVALFRAARQRAMSEAERIPAVIALLRALNQAGRSMEVSREGEALLAGELSPVESARITLQYLIARSVLEEERARDNPDDLFPPEDIEGRLKELVSTFEANALAGEAAEVHYQLARLMARRNMPKEALAETEKVFGYGDKSISEVVAGSTIVLRAELFGKLGLGPETERTLLGVYSIGVTDRAILDGAADRLLALAYERATQQDQRILELRNLAARAEKLPYLLARVKLAEGKLLEELDSYTEAEAAYRVAMNQVNEAVAPALQAGLQLAGMHARRGRYQDAVAICGDIEQGLAKAAVPGAQEAYREIRRQLVRYYMEKGRAELRLGDAMLAHSTFEELLRFDPGLPQAWRGKLGAIGSDKGVITRAVGEFERETKTKPEDGLAWYKLGLALSYVDPASERARRAVAKAVAADSAVPYYHLTLGFILEQIYKKGSDRKELLEQASLSYEQAVMLADLDQDPEFFSDALLNSANVALTLGQFYKAHGLYQRRGATGFAFIDPRTELLFHWNAGIAAFRSSNPKDAAREFASAMEAIKAVADGKLVPADRLASIVQELKGRRALALMDAGMDAESARLFGELAEESAANSMDRVRALRNRALVLERLSGMQSGAEREATLEEARSVAEQGLVEVRDPRLQDSPDRSSSKAFIDFTYAYSASTTGGAQLDFNRRDEERLLRATLGRVLQLLGEGGQAIVELQGQLALDPKINDGNRAYYFSARSVTLSRIAAESLAGGDTTGAVSAALQGLTISHYQVAGQWFVNPNSATLFLGKLVEIVGATEVAPSLQDPKAFWMLGADEVKTAESNWELLDRAAQALLVYPDPALPGTGSVAVIEPLQQARLDLVRAISQERLYEEAIRRTQQEALLRESPPMVGDSGGISSLRRNMMAAVHAGRANAAADELLALCRAASNTEEIYLLGSLAWAVKIRLAFGAGFEAEGEKQTAAALDFARQTGQPALSWWLMAQAATTARTEEARLRWTKSALDQLLSQAVYTEEGDPRPPEAMLAVLEAIQLDKALRDNDAAGLWTVTENWRIVRLRWLAAGASAPTRTAEEGRWLQEYVDSGARHAEKNQQLRRTPFASAVQRGKLLAERDGLSGRLAALVSTGLETGSNAAVYCGRKPLEFEWIDGLLQPPFFTEQPPAFILDRRIGGLRFRAVYTPEGTTIGRADEPLPAEHALFLYGEETPEAPDSAVRVLSGASLYRRLTTLQLPGTGSPVKFPPEGFAETAAAGSWVTDLQLAPEVEFVEPVRMKGLGPQTWALAESRRSLPEIVRLAESATKGDLKTAVDPSRGIDSGTAELAVASYLDASGMTEATINGKPWLGVEISPRLAPERAQEELAVLYTALEKALAENKATNTITSIEKIILLKESLGETSDLELYYGKLADERGRLGRWMDAAQAEKRRLALLREADGDPVYLAWGIKRYADTASGARLWDESFAAYDEAVAQFAKLDLPDGSLATLQAQAISLENAGRFAQAIEASDRARMLAEKVDPAAMVAQDLRVARILRVYLSRYDEAAARLREAMGRAKPGVDDASLAELKINLARTLMNTARFEEATALIGEVAALAEQLNSDGYRAQAKLESANIHWLRSEYFDAFREQQEVLEIAARTKDVPVEIAVRNVAGLTAWSVNDLKRAHSELDQALALAEAAQDDAKVATTHNNIGLLNRSEKEYDAALVEFGKALEIDQRQGNRWGEAYALRNTGITLHLAGRSAEAVGPLSRAVELATQIGDRVNLAKARLALADAHAALDNRQLALSGYTQALEGAKGIPLPEIQWRSLHGMGRLALAEGKTQEALDSFEQAVDIVDGLRASIRIEELQDGFLLDKQDLYSGVIELKLQLGDVAGALESSEKSRGRNFIDLLGNRRINLGNIEDQNLLDREKVLRESVEALERRAGATDGTEKTEIGRKLTVARQEYSDFLVFLRTKAPEVSGFVRVEPVNIAELQALVEPETRLLVYHLLPSGAVCWVVGPESLELVRLPVTAEELPTRILDARVRLQNLEPVEEDLQELANDLVTPLFPFLEGVKRVCVVPHQELHTLPFAALSLGGGRHLIDRFAIYYAPSASVLRYTIARRADRTAEQKVLAIGNPDVGDPKFNLPFAEKEAERMQYDFPAVTIKTGDAATESWLVKNLPQYGLIHIASHGEFNPDAPLFSAVQLAPDGQNDGRLTSAEVFNLQLRADLIALSACQSGLGRVSKGDDIVGLNRAFVYAGTRQIMTTLWRVDDISTAVLFKYFYRNNATMDRAEALRDAQVRLKNRPEYRHPAHWAGLVLSGDWE